MAMGFLEGSIAEVVHEAPFGGDPLAVRVRGTLLALRRQEANAVEVVQDE
jgi:ferrous iron transport protein A